MVSDVTFSTVIDGQSSTAAASTGLAEDFSQFLNLLTVQLQNQDPLDPMDTSEFTNQIVAFTGVEQQINTNQKLDSLLASQIGQAFSAAQNYVGKSISYVSSELSYDGAPVSVKYSLPEQAAVAKVNIFSEDGALVYSEDVSKSAGVRDFVWDGSLRGGGKATSGTYTISVDAVNLDEKPMEVTTVVKGRVHGTETHNGAIYLLVGERAVSLSNVLNTSVGNSTNDVSDAFTLALRYIGLDATYENSVFDFDGSNPVDLDYTLEQEADRAKIFIQDNTGKTLATYDIPTAAGANTFTWDGTLPNGRQLGAGEYRFVIDAIASNSTEITSNTVITNGSDSFDVDYTLEADADQVEAVVTNGAGTVVYRETIDRKAGTHTFTWDSDIDGAGNAPAGTYDISIRNVSSTDSHVDVSTYSNGTISGVETAGGSIYVTINGQNILLSDITNVRQPPQTSS